MAGYTYAHLDDALAEVERLRALDVSRRVEVESAKPRPTCAPCPVCGVSHGTFDVAVNGASYEHVLAENARLRAIVAELTSSAREFYAMRGGWPPRIGKRRVFAPDGTFTVEPCK